MRLSSCEVVFLWSRLPVRSRVSNCVIRFLKQFEARRIEAMAIGNFLTKSKEGSSSELAMLATI